MRKDFEDFPAPVQMDAIRALTIAAEGHMANHVKPLKGFDTGIMEMHERLKRLKEMLQ